MLPHGQQTGRAMGAVYRLNESAQVRMTLFLVAHLWGGDVGGVLSRKQMCPHSVLMARLPASSLKECAGRNSGGFSRGSTSLSSETG